MSISTQTYSPIYQHYENINGTGEAGFNQYQNHIGGLNYLDGSNGTNPADPNSHKDRMDKDGNVYSWDQNAEGGKGAWGVSGHINDAALHLYEGTPNGFPFVGGNYTKQVIWSSSEQYSQESGLSYTSTSSAYDPIKDLHTVGELNYLDGSNGTNPADPNSHKDRMDKDGNVYSWDQNAEGGKGAWRVSGHINDAALHLYEGTPNGFPFVGANYTKQVIWSPT
jgi:alpha-tubulin suppressor-like RCC1 family protein